MLERAAFQLAGSDEDLTANVEPVIVFAHFEPLPDRLALSVLPE